jgi:hypothetical protein
MFNRPWRQTKHLLVPLHLTLDMHQGPSTLQSTDAHMPLYIACEQLILKSCDRLLECLALALEATVMVDLCNQ